LLRCPWVCFKVFLVIIFSGLRQKKKKKNLRGFFVEIKYVVQVTKHGVLNVGIEELNSLVLVKMASCSRAIKMFEGKLRSILYDTLNGALIFSWNSKVVSFPLRIPSLLDSFQNSGFFTTFILEFQVFWIYFGIQIFPNSFWIQSSFRISFFSPHLFSFLKKIQNVMVKWIMD